MSELIDLNNTNPSAFRNIPGMYPTVARMIVKHAPYQKVEDVLEIDGLSERHKTILRSNFDKFTVIPRKNPWDESSDRFQPL
jgi:photosystem II PsbU protein